MNNKVVFLGVLLLAGGCSFKNPYYDKLHGTWTCNGRGQTFAGDTYHANGRFTRYLIENDRGTFQTGTFSLDRSLLILKIDQQSVGLRSEPLKYLPKQIVYKYAISQLTSTMLDFKMKSTSVGRVLNQKTQVCRKVKEQRVGLLYSSAKIGAAFKVPQYVTESPLTIAIRSFKSKSVPGVLVSSAAKEKNSNKDSPDTKKSNNKQDTNTSKLLKVATNQNQSGSSKTDVKITENKIHENKVTEDKTPENKVAKNKVINTTKPPQKIVHKVKPVVLKSKDKKVTITIREGTAGLKSAIGASDNTSNPEPASDNSLTGQSESKNKNVVKPAPPALDAKEKVQTVLVKPGSVKAPLASSSTPKVPAKVATVNQSQNSDKKTAANNADSQHKAGVPKAESNIRAVTKTEPKITDGVVSTKTKLDSDLKDKSVLANKPQRQNDNDDNYPVISDTSSSNKNSANVLSLRPEPEPNRDNTQYTSSASTKSENTKSASVTQGKEIPPDNKTEKIGGLVEQTKINNLIKLQHELIKEIVLMDAFQRDRNRAHDTMGALSLALVSGLNIQTLTQKGNLFTISGHSDTNLAVVRYVRKLSDSPHLFSVKLKRLAGKKRHRKFEITFQQAHSINSYNYLTVKKALHKQDLTGAKRRVFELRNIRNGLLYRYPNKAETSLLIRKLAHKAKIVGLKVITFDKQKIIKKERYNIIPVRIEAIGHYSELIVYLNRLGRRKHFNRVRNLKIQRQSEHISKAPSLFISMTLYLIRMPEQMEKKRKPALNVKFRLVKLTPYNRVPLVYDGGVKNPFKYIAARDESNCNGPLNGYQIDHIKLVAVFNYSNHLALLKTPDGKIYRARSGSCIARNTRIGKITRKSIVLKSVSRHSGKPIVEVFNLDLQRNQDSK